MDKSEHGKCNNQENNDYDEENDDQVEEIDKDEEEEGEEYADDDDETEETIDEDVKQVEDDEKYYDDNDNEDCVEDGDHEKTGTKKELTLGKEYYSKNQHKRKVNTVIKETEAINKGPVFGLRKRRNWKRTIGQTINSINTRKQNHKRKNLLNFIALRSRS